MNEAQRPPRAFICHASDDKARFVVRFAERLREAGIDAWLDQWEMQPGDSLVSKIFDEGIAEADCVIVVVSHHSITRRWVREELEAAMMRAVEEGVRVIPVLIDDDCDVPEPLRSRIWLPIRDLKNYDDELRRLISTIFGQSERPPLGAAPRLGPAEIPGLDPPDARVLRESCRLLIKERKTIIAPADLAPALEPEGLTVEEVVDSIEVLGERGLVKISGAFGMRVRHFRVTPRGLLEFARAEHDLGDLRTRLLALAANEEMRRSTHLSEALGIPEVLVHAILHSFSSADLKVSDYGDSNAPFGRRTEITYLSPRIKRRLG